MEIARVMFTEWQILQYFLSHSERAFQSSQIRHSIHLSSFSSGGIGANLGMKQAEVFEFVQKYF